jgi:ribonuclease E
MANKMLIDATHPEETRVVVVRGNRVEEFDFEAANRRPLRGNIYLAKVTRVEPSLQACFVDYGGNRHGFLAFSEIHPDYYQIPVADRQALIAEEERAARAAESDHEQRHRRREQPKETAPAETVSQMPAEDAESAADSIEAEAAAPADPFLDTAPEGEPDEARAEPTPDETGDAHGAEAGNGSDAEANEVNEVRQEEEVVESVGAGDALEEVPERQHRQRRHHYKIQEVIKRRQVMLVQVVKEERGTKGAAMTTYLSLAGRYSVLMPNTSRGGGISRKITDGADRKRLKDLVQDLEVPEGMGVILRTAGASRTKAEIKRDYEYLLRLWETVRELTLKSTAAALVYEEGSLTKRAIRDLYNKDIDEILVAGDDGYKEAKEFMRMLMPSHAKNVKPYKESQPVFVKYGVESQLDAMFSPVVQLKSGGYIVINPAEALVAIDVNSGRSTREHHIEDTALRTNTEAAEEVARQLRLRDLAGLIVIDFIDMEQKRNNRNVERKLKDSLKHDRARIQVGRISHFGLLEMSRQRIRTGVLESSTVTCPHCGGTGHVRSVSSVALHLLRSLEEQLLRSATNDLIVRTKSEVALYLLNQKRAHLRELEQRFGVNILIQADATLAGQQYFAVDRGPLARPPVVPVTQRVSPDTIAPNVDADEEEEEEEVEAEESESEFVPAEGGREGEPTEPGRGRRRRRRRRGRGRGREGLEQQPAPPQQQPAPEYRVEHGDDYTEESPEPGAHADQPLPHGDQGRPEGGEHDGQRRRRRRGRRGGRRNRRGRDRFEQRPPDGQYEGGPEQAEDAPIGDPYRPMTEPGPEPAFEPSERLEEAPPLPVQSEELPRRGSTVREPAIARFDDAPPPAPTPYRAPEPQASEERSDSDEGEMAPERPRRSGWWQRR